MAHFSMNKITLHQSKSLPPTKLRHDDQISLTRSAFPAHLGISRQLVPLQTPTTHRMIHCAASSQSGRALKSAEDPDSLCFTAATIVDNKQASADGSARILLLSVEDPSSYSDGRRLKHIQETSRWLDDYRTPGQFVAIKHCATGGSLEGCTQPMVAKHLFPLTSSPYETRSSSALLDASMIEICVSREGSDAEKAIADLGPGALIEVSEVLGGGFNSLFNSAVNLQSALEEGRPLLAVAVGCSGMAALRAVMEWTPVQAHATSHKVTLLYVTKSSVNAAFILDWDLWREAGVHVHVIYMDELGETEMPNNRKLAEILEGELFHREHGFVGALNGGSPTELAVLMAGVPGDAAAHLTKKFTHSGVASERLLFCDFF